MELVQPFRLALLKLASQESARLMAAGEYELALPVALDAVKQGQALFRPAPALQLFPLYLLAAQVGPTHSARLSRRRSCADDGHPNRTRVCNYNHRTSTIKLHPTFLRILCML